MLEAKGISGKYVILTGKKETWSTFKEKAMVSSGSLFMKWANYLQPLEDHYDVISIDSSMVISLWSFWETYLVIILKTSK